MDVTRNRGGWTGDPVLASASPGGHRVQVVRDEADRLAITVDGKPLYHWPVAAIESCVQVYLKLLLRHPGQEAK